MLHLCIICSSVLVITWLVCSSSSWIIFVILLNTLKLLHLDPASKTKQSLVAEFIRLSNFKYIYIYIFFLQF